MSGNLCQRIEAFFRGNNLLDSRLIVAVSGGADSVCLLHALATLKNELGLGLYVAHLDHMLRGEESQADAEYVETLTSKMMLSIDIGHVDVQSLRCRHKMTLEEAAREARYGFLAQTADKYVTDIIVTGHTQNDQIETILLHIIRGCGVRGLVGLQPIVSRTIGKRQVKIIRPLLNITKNETQEYCERHNLLPRLDRSNLDPVPMRNRMRLQLLPLLEMQDSNVSEEILRLSSAAKGELACLDNQTSQLMQRATTIQNNVIIFDRLALINAGPAALGHLLRGCLERLLGDLHDIESIHIDGMLSLMQKPAGRQMSLPHGLLFLTGYDSYRLGKEEDLSCPFPPLENKYRLGIPGEVSFPGWQAEVTIVQTMDRADDPMVAYMDLDATGEELWVRCWQEGDFFQPLGLGSIKKLGRYMIDARIPKLWRKKIPLVMSPVGIVWLVGYRLDDRAKVTSQTKRILRLKFQRI
ncbi:MAG: tRNA lysidine(34) synthetase TilS [Dehalococcoidia bacterium]|nr:tRNA lysidine(34) synthetase TilS [Dehalococcoidia bacterium]